MGENLFSKIWGYGKWWKMMLKNPEIKFKSVKD